MPLLRYSPYIVLFFTLVLVSFFGEKIPVDGGLGWDGFVYSNLSTTAPSKLINGEVDTYYIYRILPPLLINFFSAIFQYNLTKENVINSFLIMNFLLLCVSVFFYLKSAKLLKLKEDVTLLGFILLFFTFPVLKQSFYYPILTDTFAFTIGIITCYYFFRNSLLGLAITTFIGTFVFPTILYAGCILMLFNSDQEIKRKEINKLPVKIILLIVFIISVGFSVVLFYLHKKGLLFPNYFLTVNPINKNFLLVSIAAVVAYLSFFFISVFRQIYPVSFSFRSEINYKRIAFVILYFIAIKFAISALTIPKTVLTPQGFFVTLIKESITNPFTFLVSHIAYFGIGIFLILISFKLFLINLLRYGHSALLFVSFYILLSIGNESRQFINAVPFFILILLITFNQYNLNTKVLIGLAVLQLFVSKIWLPINISGQLLDNPKEFLNYPAQLYFMNQGPWMSDYTFYIHLALIIPLSLLVYSLKNKIIRS